MKNTYFLIFIMLIFISPVVFPGPGLIWSDYLGGTWYGDGVVGGTYMSRYFFYTDGTFEFFGQQPAVGEPVPRKLLLSESGRWEERENSVYIYIDERVIQHYENGRRREETDIITPEALLIIDLRSLSYDISLQKPIIKINGKTYWYFPYVIE